MTIRQFNAISKNSYSGENLVSLSNLQRMKGYKYPIWLTYKQAQSLGLTVRKGEKGSKITFFSKYEKENKKEGAFFKYYTVFNIAQCLHFEEQSEVEVNQVEDGLTIDVKPIDPELPTTFLYSVKD